MTASRSKTINSFASRLAAVTHPAQHFRTGLALPVVNLLAHSLRSWLATTVAMAGMPLWKIARTFRRKWRSEWLECHRECHRASLVGGGFPFRQSLRLNRILAEIELAPCITGQRARGCKTNRSRRPPTRDTSACGMHVPKDCLESICYRNSYRVIACDCVIFHA